MIHHPSSRPSTIKVMLEFIYEAHRVRPTRVLILVMLLAVVVAPSCLGDQLQWNNLAVCEKAAQAIGRRALLISYCSQADEDLVQLWLVRDLKIAATPIAGLYEVIVSVRCLYRSIRPYSSEELPLSDDQWTLSKAGDGGWHTEGIDLAYVYIHIGGSSFHCLGKTLKLDCMVAVESITVPDDVMEELAAGRNRGHRTFFWPLDTTPKRSSVGVHP